MKGRVPNSKRLNLESVGVHLDKVGAVKADEFSRTYIPRIWAIGYFSHVTDSSFSWWEPCCDLPGPLGGEGIRRNLWETRRLTRCPAFLLPMGLFTWFMPVGFSGFLAYLLVVTGFENYGR
ncbi:hypothetical protein DM860_008500 [Cuscuta australis]|uniref:Uncharacterized protein n=1 Tax=Cuscuta australis TaxID=267555 RepID=A0A328D4S1_9ASTE|nr:hypothetical protein DM860_008500 [Cuscuta australis]